MTRSHNEPDFEAEKVSITADRIRKDEKKFRRTAITTLRKCRLKEMPKSPSPTSTRERTIGIAHPPEQ